MNEETRRYCEARDQIRSGDLLLFRPSRSNLLGRLIAIAGRSKYCHVGMADWRRFGRVRSLRCLEMVASGGRDVTLARLVERYPGLIDVYEANPDNRWPEFNRDSAAGAMLVLINRRYGFWNLLCVALRHLFLVRLFVRAETDDQIKGGRPPFCSHALAVADQIGGTDPVVQLSNRMTEPADLARSLFYRYRFTLIP